MLEKMSFLSSLFHLHSGLLFLPSSGGAVRERGYFWIEKFAASVPEVSSLNA